MLVATPLISRMRTVIEPVAVIARLVEPSAAQVKQKMCDGGSYLPRERVRCDE